MRKSVPPAMGENGKKTPKFSKDSSISNIKKHSLCDVRSKKYLYLTDTMDLIRDLLECGPVDETRLFDALEGCRFRRGLQYAALRNFQRTHSEQTKLFLSHGIWVLARVIPEARP